MMLLHSFLDINTIVLTGVEEIRLMLGYFLSQASPRVQIKNHAIQKDTAIICLTPSMRFLEGILVFSRSSK